jgi:hypothetical protein
VKAVLGSALVGLLLEVAPTKAADVEKIDWSELPSTTLPLFYPGQSSYQWLRSEEHKRVAKAVEDGDPCLECHREEEADLGEALVVEHSIEPNPVDGKVSLVPLEVQAANDEVYLYMRFSWKSSGEGPGDMGNFMRYDGSEWQWYGNHRQHEAVVDDGQPAIYPDRLGIMIGDENVDMYPGQGCWMTCHDSMVGMEDQAIEDEVAQHPVVGALYKQFGLSNDLVRKFLPESRTDETAWDAVASAEELKSLREEGKFLDLIIWDAALTNPAGVAADYSVLEVKSVDEGRSQLWPNGKMRQGPAYVFDKAAVGFSVLAESDLEDPAKAKHLIVGKTTASADGVEFKEGDILPAHILDSAKAKGSAADVDYAKGSLDNGTYTVVMRRKLDTGNPLDDKILEPDTVYTFGFSVHDDAAGKRAHVVSFPVTLSIGEGEADIQTVTLD